MDPMTMLALASTVFNTAGNLMGGGGGATKKQKQLHNMTGTLLGSFLEPGAFNPGGYGDNYFFGGMDGVKQFLAQPSPEMKTFDTVRPILESMLTGTGPQFERDIAMANSSGGRFSSGNAILRGEALRNLYNMRNTTADTLMRGAGSAGSSQWDRLFAAQSQKLQLLAGLFGMGTQFGQNAADGGGMNAFSSIGQGGMDLAKLLTILKDVNGGGGGKMPQGMPVSSGPVMV